MTPEQFEELKKFVTDHFDYKLELFEVKFDAFAKNTTAWQNDAKPAIDLGKNVTGFSKTALYIAGFFAAIYGFIRIVVAIFNKHSI